MPDAKKKTPPKLMTRPRCWILLIFITMAPSFVQGAQYARVITEEAKIHSDPDSESQVFGTAAFGEILTVSSASREGWYKVKLPRPDMGSGNFGWVKSDEITPETLGKELKAAGIQATLPRNAESNRHHWAFVAFGGPNIVSPTALQIASGVPTQSLMVPFIGGQLGYRLSTRWTLALHGEHYTFALDKGTVGGLSLEYFMLHSLPWKIGLAVMGGGLFGQGFSPAGSGRLTLRWYLWDNLAFILTSGYRYLIKKNLPTTSGPVDVAMSAFIGELGIQVEF